MGHEPLFHIQNKTLLSVQSQRHDTIHIKTITITDIEKGPNPISE